MRTNRYHQIAVALQPQHTVTLVDHECVRRRVRLSLRAVSDVSRASVCPILPASATGGENPTPGSLADVVMMRRAPGNLRRCFGLAFTADSSRRCDRAR